MIKLTPANAAIIIIIAALGILGLRRAANSGFAKLPIAGPAVTFLAAA